MISQANAKAAARQYDAPEVKRAEAEVLSKLPDPAGTNLLDRSETAWLNWFAVGGQNYNKTALDPVGEGCLEPCSFCERGNISGWSRDDPLYVVAATIRNSLERKRLTGGPLSFQGTFGNNVIEWLDPFFHFDIGSLAASLARLNYKTIIATIIKAFNADDPRLVNAVQRLSGAAGPNYRTALILSFHLGIGSPDFDIIRSVAGVGGGRIPEEIIDRYARRYAGNFRALGPAIKRVLMYGLGFGIRQGGLADEVSFDASSADDSFNWATRQAFIRAVALAGLDIRNLPFKIDLPLDRRPLHNGGRGSDFLRRFDRAFYRGEYLAADQDCGQDLIDKPTAFTRVKRKADGTVLVVNPQSPEETLVQTTLDELWPIGE